MPRFVGRQAELERVRRWLGGGERLVSILGPPGIGKTALARRIAEVAEQDGHYRGGLRFVDLTHAATADDLAVAIAHAFDLDLSRDIGKDLVAEVGSRLSQRGSTLLLLDNLEHAAEFAEETIGRWLESAPRVSFVVTSRVALRLASEIRYDLPPLSREDARQLFIGRAQGVRVDFTVAREEEDLLGDVLTHLDCIPLAIVLAAGRMGVLSIRALAERLSNRFQILRDDHSRGRHAALEAEIADGWASLSDRERSVLIQCACFPDGFFLEDAEAIIEDPDLIARLEALRDRSFLATRASTLLPGEVRYSLYESIKAFVLEAGRADRVPIVDRIELHYLERGERWKREPLRLAAEYQNLAAIHRRSATDHPERTARAGLILDPLLAARGPARLHLELLERSLEAARSGDAEVAALQIPLTLRLAEALRVWGRGKDALERLESVPAAARSHFEGENIAGKIWFSLGRLDDAKACFARALRAADPTQCLEAGIATANLGLVEVHRSAYEPAEQLYLTALDLHRRAADRRSEALALANLGILFHERGQLERADGYLTEAWELALEQSDRRLEGAILGTQGILHQEQGHFEAARAAFQSALGIHREVGAEADEAMFLNHVAILDFEERRVPEAIEGAEASLRLARRLGRRRLEGIALAYLGFFEDRTEKLVEARRILEEVGEPGLIAACDRLARSEAPNVDASEVRLAERVVEVRRRESGDLPPVESQVEPPHVDERGAWISTAGGERTDLRRRPVLRKLLAHLVQQQTIAPGVPRSPEELVGVAWPEQREINELALNRLYVAVATLRKLGLKDRLIKEPDGYLLDPRVVIDRS